MTVAPIHDPMAPAMMIPAMLMWPCVCARYAAGGMMNSLGNGTMELSTAISSATSQYPYSASLS